MRAALLDCAQLQGAQLVDADVRGASVKEADLSGADLSGALLAGIDFTDADTWGVEFGSWESEATTGEANGLAESQGPTADSHQGTSDTREGLRSTRADREVAPSVIRATLDHFLTLAVALVLLALSCLLAWGLDMGVTYLTGASDPFARALHIGAQLLATLFVLVAIGVHMYATVREMLRNGAM